MGRAKWNTRTVTGDVYMEIGTKDFDAEKAFTIYKCILLLWICICCMTRAKYSRLTIEISDEQNSNSICESSLLVNIAYCIGIESKLASFTLNPRLWFNQSSEAASFRDLASPSVAISISTPKNSAMAMFPSFVKVKVNSSSILLATI